MAGNSGRDARGRGATLADPVAERSPLGHCHRHRGDLGVARAQEMAQTALSEVQPNHRLQLTALGEARPPRQSRALSFTPLSLPLREAWGYLLIPSPLCARSSAG